MWSLFRRSAKSDSVATGHTHSATEESLNALFEILLGYISDQATKAAFTKQYQDTHSTSDTVHQVKSAPVFQTLISFLLEHQPPATTKVLTNEDVTELVAQKVDPSQLEPELMGVLGTGSLQLAGILGIGIDRLSQVYYQAESGLNAREAFDDLLTHMPYQVPAQIYSELTADQVPSLKPIFKALGALSQEDLLANIRYLYQHFIDVLIKNNQQPQAVKAMQDVYTYISQTYPQELTLQFLDMVPGGWLEQERGNLLGREELLKVLEQLRGEKEKLEALNVRDEALLTSIGDGVVAVDQQGKVIFINNSASEMLGIQSVDVSNIKWFEDIHLVDKKDQPIPTEQSPLMQAIKTQQRVVTNDLSFLLPDKSKLAVAITASPYMINGQMTGAMLVFKDMNREREIDRQKTEFISVASHQLRTPLGSMKWNLEMLGKNYYGEVPKEASDVIKETLQVNERTIKLVNSLLNISRIETGRVQDHPTQICLLDVLEATLKEVEPLVKEKKIVMEVNKPESLPEMSIDDARLREVLENIISNAIKYSFVEGKVTIKVSQDNECIMVEVADQGMGIPEQEQFKVFSRFFRAENAMNQEPNGSGFGLFVVKSYVEGWGGKIWFKSPTMDQQKGTTFFIQIPLQVKEPADGLYLDTQEATNQPAETTTPPDEKEKKV